jgi:hypothetical protein
VLLHNVEQYSTHVLEDWSIVLCTWYHTEYCFTNNVLPLELYTSTGFDFIHVRLHVNGLQLISRFSSPPHLILVHDVWQTPFLIKKVCTCTLRMVQAQSIQSTTCYRVLLHWYNNPNSIQNESIQTSILQRIQLVVANWPDVPS